MSLFSFVVQSLAIGSEKMLPYGNVCWLSGKRLDDIMYKV
jgi:hypothetical protein